MKSKSVLVVLVAALAAATALGVMPAAARGGEIYVTNFNASKVGEYNATTGSTINASLVSTLNFPRGIVVSGGHLFVTNVSAGTIGEYDATTGATINPSLVSGLSQPYGIAVIPEPSTFALGILGALSLAAFGRLYRWQRKAMSD